MKIGVAQCDVTFNDPAANLKRAEKWISEAASQSIDLLVFPECFLTGYCVDSVEDAAKISLFCTADKTGVATSDEPSINGMTQLAKAYGLYIVFGFAGRDEQGLYNGSLMVSPEGSAHRYIKTHLPCLGLDRFVRGGSSLDVVRCGDARVGTLICYDIRPPEAARTLALKGADII
ncbi:MAG: carbon-nitrogen hydrolase family protein, partial [Armatimonadota bacterium]